jgi:hypothetical protein
MMSEQITYEIKIHRSLHLLLWAFAVGILLNAIPDGTLVRDANAQLRSGAEITVVLKEAHGIHNVDLDD